MNTNVMFSSEKDDWETPQDFFNILNEEFHFTLDPCSTHENTKCEKHYTIAENGLTQDWSGETVFCNPPYGRELPKWIQKCAEESQKKIHLLLCSFQQEPTQKPFTNTYTAKPRFAS